MPTFDDWMKPVHEQVTARKSLEEMKPGPGWKDPDAGGPYRIVVQKQDPKTYEWADWTPVDNNTYRMKSEANKVRMAYDTPHREGTNYRIWDKKNQLIDHGTPDKYTGQ